MINEILIETYFESIEIPLNSKDRLKVQKIRDSINYFKEKEKQVEFIINWRSRRENIEFDYRVFGISRTAIISRTLVDSNNEVKSSIKGQRNKNWNNLRSAEIEDFIKENKEKKDKDRSESEPEEKKRSVFNPLILWISLGVAVFVLFLNIGFYLYGFISSSGETPFVLSEGRILKGGEILNTPYLEIEGFSKVKDGYKLPMDYALARSMGYEYTGQNYEGPDDLRGIGIYSSEDFAWGGSDTFSRENYAVAGRWEHWTYTVEKNKWPSHSNYGNKSVDGVKTTGINPVYKNFDENQYSWLLDQKVLVVNPDNGKAVICMVGNGQNDTNWGGSPLSSGPLGLSYLAQVALGFKVDSSMDGGDYPYNCRDSGSIYGFQLEAFWVLEPDLYELGPINIDLTPNLLPDPTPTPTPTPMPTPTPTPEPTPTYSPT